MKRETAHARRPSAPGLNRNEAPFLEAVQAYADAGIVPFHTPGHKQGRGASPALVESLGPRASLRLTCPTCSCPLVQDSWTAALSAADVWRRTSWARITAIFSETARPAACTRWSWPPRPAGKIIVARNSHRSILGAVILADVWPVYVDPVYDPEPGCGCRRPSPLGSGRSTSILTAAVLVTYPTYEGVAMDLAPGGGGPRPRGLAVLVDEAHGPHFDLHSAVPPRALAGGGLDRAKSPQAAGF